MSFFSPSFFITAIFIEFLCTPFHPINVSIINFHPLNYSQFDFIHRTIFIHALTAECINVAAIGDFRFHNSKETTFFFIKIFLKFSQNCNWGPFITMLFNCYHQCNLLSNICSKIPIDLHWWTLTLVRGEIHKVISAK